MELILLRHEAPADVLVTRQIDAWRSQSAAHHAAWQQAEKLFLVAGPNSNPPAAAFASKFQSRRWILGGVAAAAAAVAAVPFVSEQAKADYATGTGEVRNIAFPDGSSAVLAPVSAIAVHFTGSERAVDLLAGASFFQVATAPTPLMVRCLGLSISSADGIFELSRDSSTWNVAVSGGTVLVDAPLKGRLERTQVLAGEWVSIDEDDAAIERGTRSKDQVAAWREKLVIAERETIPTVVAKIARWLPEVVTVAPGFGQRRVSGIFNLDDPRAALNTVVAPFGGKVRQITPWLTVLSTI
jgi:transmembrane sensor